MIRTANRNDRSSIYNLKAASSAMKTDSAEFYFAHQFDHKNIVVNEVNGHLCASLQVNHHSVVLDDKRVMGSFVIGELYESKSGRKYIDALWNDVIDNEQYRSLITFVPSSKAEKYAQFGFAPVYKQRVYKVKREDFKYSNYEGVAKSFKLKELSEIYQGYSANFTGFGLRDDRYFSELVSELSYMRKNIVVYHDEEGQPQGYMIYTIMPERIHISELIYLNGKALIRLLCYGLHLKPNLDVCVSQAEDLSVILPDSEYSLRPVVLARINDYELFNRLFGCEVNSVEEGFAIFSKPLFNNERS